MKNKILYGEKQMPALLDTLQEAYPLKHRELHIEHSAVSDTRCVAHVCDEGHIHFLVAALTPHSVVTLMGLYAYTLAIVLDAKKDLPKKPNQCRVQRIMQSVMEALAEEDAAVAHAFVIHSPWVWQWIDWYGAGQPDQPSAGLDDTVMPRLAGVLGIPLVTGVS